MKILKDVVRIAPGDRRQVRGFPYLKKETGRCVLLIMRDPTSLLTGESLVASRVLESRIRPNLTWRRDNSDAVDQLFTLARILEEAWKFTF